MINTEAKALQRDIRKTLSRISKLPKTRNSEVRKMNRNFAQMIAEYDRQIATEKKHLEAQKDALTKRLNLILGRAGK